jgi:hypothetical protein
LKNYNWFFFYNSVNFMAIANGEILYILLDRIVNMAMKSFCWDFSLLVVLKDAYIWMFNVYL